MLFNALAENWRLLVIALVVGATSFAAAFVLAARTDEGGSPGALSTASAGPARTPRAGDVRVPESIQSLEELHAVATQIIGEPPEGAGYDGYRAVTSANAEISVELPPAWTSTEPLPWLGEDDQRIGESILATPEASRFYQAWDTPGAFVGASREIAEEGPDALLDGGRIFHEQSCIGAGRGDVADDLYIGRFEIWYECGGGPTVVVSVAMQPRDAEDVMVAVYMKLVTAYDLGALERILETLSVDPGAVG